MSVTWPEAPLGNLCDVQIGKTPIRNQARFWGDGYPWLSISDMRQGRWLNSTKESVTQTAVDELNLRPVAEGTVLLSFKLSIGKVGIAATEIYTNEAIAHLPIVDSRIDRDYLYWALKTIPLTRGADRAAMGATLNKAKLKKIPIPLPPIEEQRRIAAVLDAADALRAKRRQALAKLDTLTQAIFIDMFGDGSKPQGRWPSAELAEVVARGTTVTYGIVQAGKEVEGGVPYIRTGDIVSGRIRSDKLRHTDPEIANRFPRSEVRSGEIVMSIRATVGTTALVPPELDGANLTQGTARIAPGPGVEHGYLLEYLRTETSQRWIQRQVKGATFREITLTRLRQLPVLLPPLRLQREYSERCNEEAKLRANLDLSLAGLEKLFASLQQRAFRGEL